MNFDLPYLPQRASKPRTNGLTMMMDKGLSIRQVEDFIETAERSVWIHEDKLIFLFLPFIVISMRWY